MKRMTSLLLALALLAALAATPTLAEGSGGATRLPPAAEQLAADLAAREGGEEAASDLQQQAEPERTIDLSAAVTQNAGKEEQEVPTLKFEDIRRRVASYNPTAKMLSEQEDDLDALDPDAMEAGLAQLKTLQSSLSGLLTQVQMAAGSAPLEQQLIYGTLTALLQSESAVLTSQITSMDSQIATLKSSRETGVNAITDGLNQLVKGVETLYIGIITMEAAMGDVQRGIAALDRAVAILEKQQELGMASAYDVESIRHQRSGVASQLKALEFQLMTTRMTMESMLGYELTGTIQLEMPAMPTAEQLAAVDYDKTVRTARDRNVNVMNAFYDWWEDSDNKTKELTLDAAEADFDVAYKIVCLTVGEKERLLSAAEETVAFQERTFAIEAKKYEMGMISHEEYLTAQSNLKQAESDRLMAQLELFTAYRSYLWGKDYGIV